MQQHPSVWIDQYLSSMRQGIGYYVSFQKSLLGGLWDLFLFIGMLLLLMLLASVDVIAFSGMFALGAVQLSLIHDSVTDSLRVAVVSLIILYVIFFLFYKLFHFIGVEY